MAQRVSVELLDDLDSSPAAESIGFGIDGVSYVIDLSNEHAEQLRAVLAPWVGAARKLSRRTNGTDGRRTRPAIDYDPAAVRAWAATNGIQVSPRGRIAAVVVEKYHAAGY
ncbi:MAG: Lsr2 family protein [Bifidobacteriaceae bacterium]|jgi:hypothetical protein|nr:Lsr2 family protein [Bifidobacteriaceae bacterium]